MKPRVALAALVLGLTIGDAYGEPTAMPSRPNIVILYADDMGFGDLGIQNPDSKIPTPHLDQLAREGARFTDAHSSSGICTPSRFALLTGIQHWRRFHNIVGALGKPVFNNDDVTMATMLRDQGYATACIGKWHLGWNWDAIRKPGAPPMRNSHDDFDWSKPVPGGPLDRGFDHYFGDAVINFPPYAWIEDDKLLRAPDSDLTMKTLVDPAKEGRWEARPGPALSDWDFYKVLPTLTEKAVEYVRSRKGAETPFFLYVPFPSPHAPIIPNDQFDGTSKAGPFGDFVVETDDACGRIIAALEEIGATSNTIVVFTADNGPERYAYARDEKFDHWSSGPFRGLKRDIYEGGHRVPTIIRWPGVLEPGSVCDALFSQVDLMATIASAVGYELPDHAALDSHDFFPFFTRKTETAPRRSHVHNTQKDHYAIRDGQWLLIDAKTGYVSGVDKEWEKRHHYPTDKSSPVELYDMESDPGQRTSLASDHPDIVKKLQALLATIRSDGHSAPRLAAVPTPAPATVAAEKPNIIFIMADDQGYGDASSYNPESKIPTPGIDRIAKEGIRFTDAHSGSAVCTPTRYGLLTGRYSWRSRLQKGVMVTGDKEGSLIDSSILTVPKLLKEHGYKTALVGKWHLGYSYEFPEGSDGLRNVVTEKPYGKISVAAAPVGSRIIDGPVEYGFDEFHGFHHAREMHSWAQNDRVVETIPLDQVITREADESIRFIETQAKASTPFFLYLALGSPHTPIVPSDEWFGKSGINVYADFVMETDHATVRVLDALDRLGIANNTLVVFTTDNGCSPAANFSELRKAGHDPSYSLRGMKADAWDGGHRVPYVVRWPGVIAPGRVSDEIICHNNLMATAADILGATLPEDAGVDSFSILPVLRGDAVAATHPFVIHHSINGRFAIRKGDWKFIAARGSGGWTKGDDGKPSQLYDMASDRKESQNLAEEKPNIVAELTRLLETAVENGRTTPGPIQKNDVKVIIWKDGAKRKA